MTLSDQLEALEAVEVTQADWDAANRAFDVAFSGDTSTIDADMACLFARHRIAALRLAETSAALPDVAGLVERIHFHLCKLTVPDDVFDLLTIEELQQISATLTAQAQRIAELETILVQENPPLTNAALKKRIAELEAENARLREALATMANSINIVGSHYDHAVQALDALVRSIKTQARAALKGGRDDEA